MIMSATLPPGMVRPALLPCAIVGNGSIKDIKKIIDHAPAELTRRSKKNEDIYVGTKATPGYLPIHYAAERGRLDIINIAKQTKSIPLAANLTALAILPDECSAVYSWRHGLSRFLSCLLACGAVELAEPT